MLSADHHRRFLEICEAGDRFLITTHVHPDGDALGSQIGLARFLASRGKHARILNVDPAPEILRFIEDPENPVEIYDPERHDAEIRDIDRIVLVDNSVPDRLGRLERRMMEARSKTLCIDHHPSRGTPWADSLIDDQSCATAVMIYELTKACAWVPDAVAAMAIYVGVATDTGFFRFNSTNAQAHAVAAALLNAGVEPARAYEAIHERNSEAYTRLLGHALVGMRLEAQGALASVALRRDLIHQLNAENVDVSEITTALLALDGIRLALLFRELPDGRVKVSLRSKGQLDVHRLAAEFGGGGHRNASGIVISGDLEEVVRMVTTRSRDFAA